jgi:SAM-dependent methyltransferase
VDHSRRFDDAYYERFYLDPATRVCSPEDHRALAEFVFQFAKWNGIEIERVLDIGAGVGLWKNWIAKNRPEVTYLGTEVSPAMCKQHGYEAHDIARWRDRHRYDLIICQGVLQYLPDPDVAPAIANIAAMSRGLVFLEVLTRADLRERADTTRTDSDVHVRNGSYYRGILAKHLITIGGGLYWPKTEPMPFWELDVPAQK